MKKILLILTVFLLTGCYDYVELDELKIVSSLIIDYQEDEYIVNLEVLDTSEDAENGSHFVEGRGSTLMSAIHNTRNGSDFSPYFSHMNVVIVSEEVARDGLERIYDNLLRNIEIRKDFYLLVTDDIESILSFESEPGESLGDMAKKTATKLIENNGKYRTCQFREVINSYLRDKDFLLGNIIIEGEDILLKDSYLFSNSTLVSKIPEEIALMANIINGKNDSFQVDGINTYEIHEYELKKNIEKDKIVLEFTGKARILDIQSGSAISTNNLKKLEDALCEKIKKMILDGIDYSEKQSTDVFGFNYDYYLHYPKLVKNDTWAHLDYEVNVDISISEKGMIMDSVGGIKYGK